MSKQDEDRVHQHVTSLVTMAMRPFPNPALTQPTLDGLKSSSDELKDKLTSLFLEAARDLEESPARPAHRLARVALEASRWLHSAACAPKGRPRGRSCKRDAKAIEHVLGGIALSLLDLQIHGDVGDLISDAANAEDLNEVPRVDGLAAKLAELLHPHSSKRLTPEIIDGSPVFQFNAPIRGVSKALYLRNRATAQELAPIAEEAGFRVDVTSDYASPGHPSPGQEYMVRAGVLRAAAIVFIMNGAGAGTGRAVELAASALTPVLLLRRVSSRDPEPPNEDRHSGEITGISEMLFSTSAQARELLRGFVSSESENIAARQRRLESLENGPIPIEADRMLSADESAFIGGRISIEEARFWVDPIHFPYAGDARRAAIRHSLGMSLTATAGQIASIPGQGPTSLEERSMRALAAFCRINNLGPERALALWAARSAIGPSHARRDPPLTVEDWADVNRRTSE
jgi:hypothetical protein